VISLVVGIALAAAAYFLTYALAGHDYEHGERAAGRFIFYITGLAFAIGYGVTNAILVHRDKKKWREDSFPKAKIR
jgi:hypothetical protein